jgi:hypothetical protein
MGTMFVELLCIWCLASSLNPFVEFVGTLRSYSGEENRWNTLPFWGIILGKVKPVTNRTLRKL